MAVCTNTFIKYTPGKLHYDPIIRQWGYHVQIPCGKCTSCKIQIAKEWALRCCLELPYWEKAIFTTLTYRNSDYGDMSLHKEEMSEFAKNLRNDLRAENRKIKILGCGEYGDKSMRKHMHAIIFGIGMSNQKWQYGSKPNEWTYLSENSIIEKNWNKGNVINGTVTYNSCRYVASYVFKKYYDDLKEQIYTAQGLESPFQHTSQGIGRQYYDEYKDWIIKRGYIMFNGIKNTIPRYYLTLFDKESEEYKKKLDKIQIEHAEDKFWKWYKNYTNKLAKELCCSPDIFNAERLQDVDKNFIIDYQMNELKQNIAKENLAKERNRRIT